VEALGDAVHVELDLGFVPFSRVLAQMDASKGRRADPPVQISAQSVLRAIARAYRVLPFKSTCLRTSLVFCRMFRRRGLAAELRIGVDKKYDRFDSHAWVEDGRGVALTSCGAGFVPLPLPRTAPPHPSRPLWPQ